MQALRFQSGRDLFWDEVPDPVPGPGQVVVEVAAAGLCHTDVSHIDNGGIHLPFQPFTLGHEIAGAIVSIGDGVNEWRVGDRVAVIANPDGPGAASDGGYAEKVVVGIDKLVAVPAGVSDTAATVATDAGITSYRAVHTQGRVTAGDTVGIIGLGGLGMLAARIAVIAGARVLAADPKVALHPIALAQGVAECSSSILDFAGHNPDTIIDFAGMDTTADAFATVRPFGRVVQVGVGMREATIDLYQVLIKQIEYVGTNTGSAEDLMAVLDLIGKGEITPVTEEIEFRDIPAGIDRLRSGDVTGRLVAVR